MTGILTSYDQSLPNVPVSFEPSGPQVTQFTEARLPANGEGLSGLFIKVLRSDGAPLKSEISKLTTTAGDTYQIRNVGENLWSVNGIA
jgi:hypothetical protein